MNKNTPSVDIGEKPDDDAKPAPDDIRMWSVTTIIGALDKPALVYWAAEETAKAAVNEMDAWQGLADRDAADAVDWLKRARFRRPVGQRTAAELGTAVHEACEQYALSGIAPELDDEVRPFFEQFDRWLQQFQPSFEATEVTVYSPTYGYAGTLDAILTIDGVRFLVDYKTTRKETDSRGKATGPYPEQVALQLAAYRHAECAAVWRPRRFEQYRRRYYLLGPSERERAVPVPEVDTGLVLHLTPGHAMAYPMRCDAPVHDAFLHTLEAHRWVNEASKHVMGDPLLVPDRAVV